MSAQRAGQAGAEAQPRRGRPKRTWSELPNIGPTRFPRVPKGNPKGASKGNRPGTGDETLGKVMESDFLDEISDGKSMI